MTYLLGNEDMNLTISASFNGAIGAIKESFKSLPRGQSIALRRVIETISCHNEMPEGSFVLPLTRLSTTNKGIYVELNAAQIRKPTDYAPLFAAMDRTQLCQCDRILFDVLFRSEAAKPESSNGGLAIEEAAIVPAIYRELESLPGVQLAELKAHILPLLSGSGAGGEFCRHKGIQRQLVCQGTQASVRLEGSLDSAVNALAHVASALSVKNLALLDQRITHLLVKGISLAAASA